MIKGLDCGSTRKNTGKKGCDFNLSYIIGMVLVPKDWSYSPSFGDDEATIKAALQTNLVAALHDDDAADLAQFIGPFVNGEDKMKAPGVQTLGYGGQRYTDNGKYIFDFLFDKGGYDYFKKVQSYKGAQADYKTLFIDNNRVIAGTNNYTGGLVVGMKGFELEDVYVHPFKPGTPTTVAEYRVSITLADVTEMTEDMNAVKMDTDILDHLEEAAIVEVNITAGASTGTRTFPYILEAGDGTVNLALTLGAAIDTTCVQAYNKGTGTAITVSSITPSTLTGKYTVVFASGGGYSASQIAVLEFTAPSDLFAATGGYYSSNKCEVTMV